MICFDYDKIEKKYQISEYLLDQITKKALYIAQALYLEYKLLFIFNNIISHSIYAKNALKFKHINKRLGSQ